MIKYIKFATVPVKDQDRALSFYTSKLGLQVSTDQPYGEGWRWIELSIPGADTRLGFSPPSGEGNPDKPRMIFVVDDVDKTYEELKNKGVEFTEPPKTAHWGTSALFRDSEGNLLLIATP
jgi:predicted enzyme related to lactoylglutathione lyase